jgi:hypothetical protein
VVLEVAKGVPYCWPILGAVKEERSNNIHTLRPGITTRIGIGIGKDIGLSFNELCTYKSYTAVKT